MGYGDNFRDEPSFNDRQPDFNEEKKTYPVPQKSGFYWVRIPDEIRIKKEGKGLMHSRIYWNGIAQVYGVSPFLKMKVWDFPGHNTSFGNAPHLIEYGPMLDEAPAPYVEC